jgi:hypothetical protein
MTFKEYINKRPERADVQGDFMRLAKANSDLPEVTSWGELKAHMARSGAPLHVVDAGERVWSNYLTSLKDAERQRKPKVEDAPPAR